MSKVCTDLSNFNVEDHYSVPMGEERSSFVILSECSGGGKSTLLSEFARRGFAVVSEPGRQIVKEQMAIDGTGLPWLDSLKMAELILSRSMFVFNSTKNAGYVFFDRGIVDIIAYFDHIQIPIPEYLLNAVQNYRYHRKVFLTPPWEEIYRIDSERKHTFAKAASSYEAHVKAYERLGYEVITLPKVAPGERADFILRHLDMR